MSSNMISGPLTPGILAKTYLLRNGNAPRGKAPSIEVETAPDSQYLVKADKNNDGIVTEPELALLLSTNLDTRIQILKELVFEAYISDEEKECDLYLGQLKNIAQTEKEAYTAIAFLIDFEATKKMDEGDFKGAFKVFQESLPFESPKVKIAIEKEETYSILKGSEKLAELFEAIYEVRYSEDQPDIWESIAKTLGLDDSQITSSDIPTLITDNKGVLTIKAAKDICRHLPSSFKLKQMLEKHIAEYDRTEKMVVRFNGIKCGMNAPLTLGPDNLGSYIEVNLPTQAEGYYTLNLRAGKGKTYHLNGDFKAEIFRTDNPLITRIRIPVAHLVHNHDGIKAGEEAIVTIGSNQKKEVLSFRVNTAGFQSTKAEQATAKQLYSDLIKRALERKGNVPLMHVTLANYDLDLGVKDSIKRDDSGRLRIEPLKRERTVNLKSRMLTTLRTTNYIKGERRERLMQILGQSAPVVTDADMSDVFLLATLSDLYFEVTYPQFERTGWKEVKREVRDPQAKGNTGCAVRALFEKVVKPENFSGELRAAYDKLPQSEKDQLKDGITFKLYYFYFVNTSPGYSAIVKGLEDDQAFLVSYNGHRAKNLPAIISQRYKQNPEARIPSKTKAFIPFHCNSLRSSVVPLTEALSDKVFAPVGTLPSVFPNAKANVTFINATIKGDVSHLTERVKRSYQNPAAWSEAADVRKYADGPAGNIDEDGDGLPPTLDPDPGHNNAFMHDNSSDSLQILRPDGSSLVVENFKAPEGPEDSPNSGNEKIIDRASPVKYYVNKLIPEDSPLKVIRDFVNEVK
ncbi:MAG: hypothetical protein ABIJ26_00420 [Candidatus Margulisiibacteriota bacterium]